MTGLVNLMEETVLEKIDQLWKMTEFCQCDKCRMDIAAFALNRLPAQYVQSTAGRLIHRFNTNTTQADAEITSVVLQAIQIVGKDPHKNPNQF